MEYISVREASIKWVVPKATVLKWCQDGLIDGATRDKMKQNSPWKIPDTAIPPRTGATASLKTRLKKELKEAVSQWKMSIKDLESRELTEMLLASSRSGAFAEGARKACLARADSYSKQIEINKERIRWAENMLAKYQR